MARQILIVEDDADVAHVVKAFLEREGYLVDVARDGLAGLDAALAIEPDLIVLDWMLPHLEGPELLRRLRRERSTPVIMLTARTQEDDRILGLDVGADDYVSKPFSPRELVARVNAVLRRLDDAGEMRSTRIEHRGLSIDLSARTVERNGVSATLTSLEFDLLATLAAAPGKVFRRSELLDRVWSEEFAGVDRVVDVHISNLRQKLAPLGAAHDVATVRGIGYKLA